MKVDDPQNSALPQPGTNTALNLTTTPSDRFSASVVGQEKPLKRSLSQSSLDANQRSSKRPLQEIPRLGTLMASEKDTDLSKIPFLKIPMAMLPGIRDPKNFNGLDEQQLKDLPKEYSSDEISHIKSALRSAVQNPSFNFQSLAPGITHSNTSIHELLSKIYDFMDNQALR